MWILFLSLLAAPLAAELPEPYSYIHELPFDDHGWFLNQEPLQALIEAHRPQIVIEVGSWLGLSTRFIAEKIGPDGKVYAVDTWRGSPNEKIHQTDSRLPRLYQLFLSNTIQAGLAEKIVPVRMESLEAAQAINVQADLIYIDAAHDTKSVYDDIIAWHKHLKPNGVLCGDDWTWKTVKIAVQKGAKELHCKVHSMGNFWWYEPL